VSNLRQLGLVTQMYWDENEDRAFRYKGASTNGGTIYWFGWIENWTPGSVDQRKFDPSVGPLFPYLEGRGVELCPSLSYYRAFRMRAAGATYGYGYNFYLSAPPSQAPLALSRVTRPSDVVLMADAAQVNDFDDPGSPENPLLEEFYYVDADSYGYPNAHFRHTERANAIFCDGHVGAESPVRGSLDERMPGQWVGRLREESLRLP
jgi:prepilin-type processing-associated H-X9-DG protein